MAQMSKSSAAYSKKSTVPYLNSFQHKMSDFETLTILYFSALSWTYEFKTNSIHIKSKEKSRLPIVMYRPPWDLIDSYTPNYDWSLSHCSSSSVSPPSKTTVKRETFLFKSNWLLLLVRACDIKISNAYRTDYIQLCFQLKLKVTKFERKPRICELLLQHRTIVIL